MGCPFVGSKVKTELSVEVTRMPMEMVEASKLMGSIKMTPQVLEKPQAPGPRKACFGPGEGLKQFVLSLCWEGGIIQIAKSIGVRSSDASKAPRTC